MRIFFTREPFAYIKTTIYSFILESGGFLLCSKYLDCRKPKRYDGKDHRCSLRSEDINILGSVTNDSAEYGIVRMVVSNPSAAVDALTKAGLLCHLTEVVGVELMDEVGNLNQLLQALSESNINVNTCTFPLTARQACRSWYSIPRILWK